MIRRHRCDIRRGLYAYHVVSGGAAGTRSRRRAYGLKAPVVGAFGEASPDLLELMEQVANATAAHRHRAYGYKSALAGRAPALAAITRGLGMVAARLNAQLVLRRLVYVGDGPHAEEAVRRRRASGRACGRTLSITDRTPARALAPKRAAATWATV